MPSKNLNEKIKNKLQKYLDHYSKHMADHAEKIEKLGNDLDSEELKHYITEAVDAIKKSVSVLEELKSKLG